MNKIKVGDTIYIPTTWRNKHSTVKGEVVEIRWITLIVKITESEVGETGLEVGELIPIRVKDVINRKETNHGSEILS